MSTSAEVLDYFARQSALNYISALWIKLSTDDWSQSETLLFIA